MRRQSRRRAARCEPSVAQEIGSELIDQCIIDGGENVGAEHPAQQVISERGIPGEHRAVEVRSENAIAEYAVDVAAGSRRTVAVADGDPPEWGHTGAECGAAPMVFKAGQCREACP